MVGFGSNPFTVLSLIAAPAILTNAASVLALGTSNRFVRVIDRARALSSMLEQEGAEKDPLTPMRVKQLFRVERRAQYQMLALRVFYLAMGNFAASALISVIGAGVDSSVHHYIFRVALWLAIATGLVGVGSLMIGCIHLMQETRLALINLSEEADWVRNRFAEYAQFATDGGEP